MITYEWLRELALSFPETTEQPHFEKTSFRLGKRIFATYDREEEVAVLKLSESDRDIFSLANRSAIYPVPNKWGRQGWTCFNLKTVEKELFLDALKCAYFEVAPKRHIRQIRNKEGDDEVSRRS